MFVPKPATYIAYDQTQSITFSRVSGAVSALSTFDITVHLKNGAGSSQFSNINKEDLKGLEDFFRLKGLRVKNEIDEDANLLAAAIRGEELSSDEEVVGAKADRGSADEDEESVDEDFAADSDSDVAEEFDSNHESDGSDSASGGESDVDEEMDEKHEEEEEEERPKKKKKTN
jgi:structure-specific recognition protein 1